MLLSKINALDSYISKPGRNKSFGTFTPEPRFYKCDFESTDEFIKKRNGKTIILTYAEIKSIKKLSDKNNKQNIALSFVRDPVMDMYFIKPQADLIGNTGKWLDITDYDNL